MLSRTRSLQRNEKFEMRYVMRLAYRSTCSLTAVLLLRTSSITRPNSSFPPNVNRTLPTNIAQLSTTDNRSPHLIALKTEIVVLGSFWQKMHFCISHEQVRSQHFLCFPTSHVATPKRKFSSTVRPKSIKHREHFDIAETLCQHTHVCCRERAVWKTCSWC